MILAQVFNLYGESVYELHDDGYEECNKFAYKDVYKEEFNLLEFFNIFCIKTSMDRVSIGIVILIYTIFFSCKITNRLRCLYRSFATVRCYKASDRNVERFAFLFRKITKAKYTIFIKIDFFLATVRIYAKLSIPNKGN